MDRYAVIGWPLDYTRSPQIHRLFAEHCREVLTYEAVPVAPQDLDVALRRFLDDPNMRGFNVTVPHKEAVLARCTALAGGAREAGAVNTVRIERPSGAPPRLIGYNTDGDGLVRDLRDRHGVVFADARVLMIGAGGAARGACGPLLETPSAALHVVNRTPARAESLVGDLLSSRPRETRLEALTRGALERCAPYDVVINATSAGLQGGVADLPVHLVHRAFCYDMLYGDDTPFERWARQHGAREVATGLGMLIEQAAEAFAIWRGARPPTDVLFDRLR